MSTWLRLNSDIRLLHICYTSLSLAMWVRALAWPILVSLKARENCGQSICLTGPENTQAVTRGSGWADFCNLSCIMTCIKYEQYNLDHHLFKGLVFCRFWFTTYFACSRNIQPLYVCSFCSTTNPLIVLHTRIAGLLFKFSWPRAMESTASTWRSNLLFRRKNWIVQYVGWIL